MRRSQQELELQDRIFAALGAERGLVMLRNAVGQVDYFNEEGERRHVTYGLGVGTPDIVCLLAIDIPNDRKIAVWLCLELKNPDGTGVLSEDQLKIHAIWRRFGAFIYVVESVQQARDAITHARTRIKTELGL